MNEENNTGKKKRMPGYPITINKNVEAVREKVTTICSEHKISASALFEALIDMQTEEQWSAYANEAKSRKVSKSKYIQDARLKLSHLSDEQLARINALLESEEGISVLKNR